MFELSDKETAENRTIICSGCAFSREYFGLGLVCGKLGRPTKKTCGCVIAAKVQFKNQSCPQNKW